MFKELGQALDDLLSREKEMHVGKKHVRVEKSHVEGKTWLNYWGEREPVFTSVAAWDSEHPNATVNQRTLFIMDFNCRAYKGARGEKVVRNR